MPATRNVRIALLAALGFFVLQVGWTISVPPYYAIDEFDHGLRASSVAAGHWAPGTAELPHKLARGGLIKVRSDVAEAIGPGCRERAYVGPYNCRPYRVLGHGEVEIASGAARYNPLFYAVVGTAAKPFHGTANLYAMRLTNALLATILFGTAVWLLLGAARTIWPLVAALLTALPTTVYSTSIATPNGLNMVAGLSTWAALLALTDPERRVNRTASLTVLAVSAATLANTHTLGVVWLALILLAVAALRSASHLLTVLAPRTRVEGLLLGTTVAAGLFGVAWTLLSGTNQPSLERTGTVPGNPWSAVVQGFILWPLQTIGAYPTRNDQAPLTTYAIEVVVLSLFVGIAFVGRATRTRTAAVTLAVAATSYVVPAVLTVRTFHQLGAAWQGRYGMPFTVGIILLAGLALDRYHDRTRRDLMIARLTVVAVVIAQVISQIGVIDLCRKLHALVDGTGWWPPHPILMVLLAAAAASAWLSAVALAHRAPAVAVPAAHDVEVSV